MADSEVFDVLVADVAPAPSHDLYADYFDPIDDEDEPDPDGPACCSCLGPTGRVPIRAWKTDDQDQVVAEVAWCDDCFRGLIASGKVQLHAS